MENVCRNHMYNYNLVISCDAPVNKSVPTYVSMCACVRVRVCVCVYVCPE